MVRCLDHPLPLVGLTSRDRGNSSAPKFGGSASFVQRGTDRRSAAREQIKASIQSGDVRLVCATDAACEGLNLQRLGAQVNVDLPWNPSRLEQRERAVCNESARFAMTFTS